MSGVIKSINPGQTLNIGRFDHLTQIQHRGNRVDIVDHFDKGPYPVDFHIIHHIDKKGKIDIDFG